MTLAIRAAQRSDLNALDALEQRCFRGDRISRRRFAFWLSAPHGLLQIASQGEQLLGYALVLLHKGTRLARLYSIAVAPEARGQGVAQALLAALEQQADERGRLFMRLEVAKSNHSAIALYQHLGYKVFGEYHDYYEDHDDALRMQKRIRAIAGPRLHRPTPWYQQTTEFTCGPASLMMAMASLDPTLLPSQPLELDIWREATTIFMTSGHGGCHPLGLALAARHRGFTAHVQLNSTQPLFIEGVRSEHKKAVMRLVDSQFRQRATAQGVAVTEADTEQSDIQRWLSEGAAVLVLISTYRMDGRKAPHWVTVTAMDERCLYVHDPDRDDSQDPLDCQHLPIAREDFAKMSSFGRERLRCAIALRNA